MSVPAYLHVGSPSQIFVELALQAGYDGVILDMQHGELDLGTATRIIRSVPRSLERVLVRIPAIDSGLIGAVLDAGAGGVIAPTVESASQASAVVRACKFAPVGRRSLGPMRPGLYGAESPITAANQAVRAYVQIETELGVTNRDEILDTDGLDGVYIGPADLALTMGYPPRLDWESGPVKEAIDHVIQASARRGLETGIFTVRPDFAQSLAREGQVSLVGLGSDQGLFNKSVLTTLQTFKEDQ